MRHRLACRYLPVTVFLVDEVTFKQSVAKFEISSFSLGVREIGHFLAFPPNLVLGYGYGKVSVFAISPLHLFPFSVGPGLIVGGYTTEFWVHPTAD